MTRGFSAVLVDLDGLLAETEHLGQQAMVEAWMAAGRRPLNEEEVGLYIGRPDREVLSELAARRGMGAVEAQKVHGEYERRYLEKLKMRPIVALPGVQEGLRRLHARHPLALVTGSTREQAEVVLRKLELFDSGLWQEMVTADDVQRGKPSPVPYRLAAERLETPLHRCLVVEDSAPGVLAGRGAGAAVLHVGPFHPQTSWIADRWVERLDQLEDGFLADLWSQRPLPAEIDQKVLARLGRSIRRAGLADALNADLSAGMDLWEAFQATAARPAPGSASAPLWRLWVAGQAVSRAQAADALGQDLLEDLLAQEVLEDAGEIQARLRLLSLEGTLLLKESPRVLPSGRWLSSKTYLESSSVKYLHRIVSELGEDVRPRARILEVGTGTGFALLGVLQQSRGSSGVGVDLDGRAVNLARANAALNGLQARIEVLQGDLLEPVADGVPFDLILFHPPYRIMPPEVPYPDPLSRYGTGRDGLGVVCRFLADLDRLLAPGGTALLFLEIPQVPGREGLLEDRLAAAAAGLRLTFKSAGASIPAAEMARIGEEKCLEDHQEEHYRLILAAYRELGADRLRPTLVRVRHRKGSAR